MRQELLQKRAVKRQEETVEENAAVIDESKLLELAELAIRHIDEATGN